MNKISLRRRLLSAIIDIVGLYLRFFSIMLVGLYLSSMEEPYFNIWIDLYIHFIIIVLIVYTGFHKDFYSGRSIGKRICRLQVVDAKKRTPASIKKCFIRNLTILIFPIEIIFVLSKPDERLGDWFAGTKLKLVGYSGVSKNKIRLLDFLKPLLQILLIASFLTVLLRFSETSVNDSEHNTIKRISIAFNDYNSKNDIRDKIPENDTIKIYRINYKSGKLKSETVYWEGKIIGNSIEWYENGQIKEKIEHLDGNWDGNYLEYDINGKILQKLQYKKGILIEN